MIDPGTTNGTPGVAHCTWGRLRASNESRTAHVRADGDVIVERLMGTCELWHPTTIPLRDDTVLRLVRQARSLDALLLPAAVAPSPAGVALATSSAAVEGVPASSPFSTAAGPGALQRTGATSQVKWDGESVGALFDASDVAATGAA